MDQHPANGSKPDDDGRCNRPAADTDGTDGLPHGFIPGDLAVALLGILVRVAHRPLSRHQCRRHTTGMHNLIYAPEVVDGRKPASNDTGASAAPLPLPPMPASRLRQNAASAAHRATSAPAANPDTVPQFAFSNRPPD